MKPVRLLHVFFVIAAGVTAWAAEDYGRRNPDFAPREHQRPVDARQPAAERAALPEAPVDLQKLDRSTAPIADRRAPVAVAEAAPKRSLPPSAEALTPAKRTPEMSAFNHQWAQVSTSEARKPELVAKYQSRLAAAQEVSIGRTPSIARSEARLNRFVFRHNAPAEPPRPADAIHAGSNPESSR